MSPVADFSALVCGLVPSLVRGGSSRLAKAIISAIVIAGLWCLATPSYAATAAEETRSAAGEGPAGRSVPNIVGFINVSPSLAKAAVKQAYNKSVAVQGGVTPYQFAITDGHLPAGLTLNPQTGAISGVPQASGVFKFRVLVTDHPRRDFGVQQVTLTVAADNPQPPPGPQPSPIVVTVSPSSAAVASGGTQSFSALVRGTSNTAVKWTATGGKISSTGVFTAPLVKATTTITVTATSSADTSKKDSSSVTVTTGSQPPPPPSGLSISTTALPGAISGLNYTAVVQATGGTQPYKWNTTAGSLPAGIQLNSSTGVLSGTPQQQGQSSFTVQVADSASHTATQALTLSVTTQVTGANFDGPAELPRVFVKSTLADTPAPGQTLSVGAGGDLQGALNSANCGDTITLQAGATFTGVFTLPAKACDDQHWIIIRSSAADSALPAEGTRLTPCFAGVGSLPGRPALNCSSTQRVVPQILFAQQSGAGPIVLAPGANHYRLLALEITRSVGTGFIGALVSAHGGAADHIVLDRLWMHGTAQEETVTAVSLSGLTDVAVIDSYINDFHCTSVVGACTDAHAVSGGIGKLPGGPYQINGNFLEAAGENILFGGGPATTTPTDIEIRHNHFFKPMQWMAGSPGFVGGVAGHPFIVKNHFELKNAQRVLFEGNILENTWGGFSQVGFSILLTPKNQALNGISVCPICQVTDVTIRNSTISHVGAGFQIANGLSDAGGVALAGERYSIHDITLDDISASQYHGGGGLLQLSNATTNVLNNVSISHITAFPDPSRHIISLGNPTTNPKMWGFVFTNNIVLSPQFPVWSTGGTSNCAAANVPLKSLTSCFTTLTFNGNVLANVPASAPSSAWPSNNFFPATVSAVDFVNFNNGNGGDYRLTSASPFKGMATDGRDPGADINAIQAATSGVY